MIDSEEKATLKEIPWPYNLIELVSDMYAVTNNELGLDFTARSIIAFANNVLTPRELSVLQTRYGAYDGKVKSLRETGALHGIQGERCRQIEARALRKLTIPTKLREYSVVPLKCLLAERAARVASEKKAEEANDRLRWVLEHCEYRMKPGVPRMDAPEDVNTTSALEMTIEDMDLSVRSYNCLKRACLNTLGDILKMEDQEQWMRIRSLGRKSLDEITKKVHSLGYKFMWENGDA